MRSLVLLATLLLGGAAFAQKQTCEDRCITNDNCYSNCSDEKCMSRCQAKADQCLKDCGKQFKGVSEKDKRKMQTWCPGPNGRRVRCNLNTSSEEAEANIKKELNDPKARSNEQTEEDKKKYNRAPTPDEIEKLSAGQH